MTFYSGVQSKAAGRAPAPQRPGLLLAAALGGVLVAAMTVIAQVLALTGGKAAIEDTARSELGAGAGTFAALLQAAVDEAYQTLQARAGVGFIVAAMVLLLALLVIRGQLWARISLAVFLVFDALLMTLSVSDVFPRAGKVIGTLSILLAILVLVLLFMPPIGRYNRARIDFAGARRHATVA
jgi:hypothetical protein